MYTCVSVYMSVVIVPRVSVCVEIQDIHVWNVGVRPSVTERGSQCMSKVAQICVLVRKRPCPCVYVYAHVYMCVRVYVSSVCALVEVWESRDESYRPLSRRLLVSEEGIPL